MDKAKWYEDEAVRAYDAGQQDKGDIFMFMADTARSEAKETKYSRLMDKADHCTTMAIRCGNEKKARRLMTKAEVYRHKALCLTIEEASR